MQVLQSGSVDMTDKSVWPELPPPSDKCMCFHPQRAHAKDDNTGGCSWSSYGTPCHCTRYRNAEQMKAYIREEHFWSKVGKHPMF